jgi:outer membrane lipoprotein SlyB
MKNLLFVLPLALALGACATSSPDVIKREDAQQLSTVLDGTVLSVRPVTVDGSQSGVGAVAGGLVGGLAGSTIGGGRGSDVAAVLGAVVGGVVGNTVERNTTQEQALEIMVQLRNGERRAIVQATGGESIAPGDEVVIVRSGGRDRVTRAPQTPAPRN